MLVGRTNRRTPCGSPDLLAGSRGPTLQDAASGQASKLSAQGVLKHLLVKTEISDHFAQLAVLVLELLEPAHLGRQGRRTSSSN
jgi:hypothetical protein